MLTWKWTKEDVDPSRVERAESVTLSNVVMNDEIPVCTAESLSVSTGDVYKVTLHGCTCRDFTVRKQPCKHMIALAMRANLLNDAGLTPDEEYEADILSMKEKITRAYGYFHLFGVRVITDEEYDRIKYDLADSWAFGDDSERILGELSGAPREAPDSAVGSGRNAGENINDLIYHATLRYLREKNAEYIDKSTSGGSLYILDKRVANDLMGMGCHLFFAENGTRATKRRPAWYLKRLKPSASDPSVNEP